MSHDFIEANKLWINGLKKRENWSAVNRKVVSGKANALGGRFIQTRKGFETRNKKATVRCAAQGYCDQNKTDFFA